jgi:GldM N-terminal domain
LQEALQKKQILQRKMVWQLKKQVEKEGNTQEGQERVIRAKKVNQATDSLLKQIDELKTEVQKTPQNSLNQLLLGAQKNGKAHQLAQKIKQYYNWLLKNNEDIGVDAELLPELPRNNPNKGFYKDTPFQNLGFAEHNFKNTNPIQAMVQLDQLQNEIYRYNFEVLKKLGAGMYEKGMRFDRIEPKVFAQSDTIRENEDFEASLVIGISPQFQYYEWYFPQQPSNQYEVKGRTLRFKTEGNGQQTWQTQLKYTDYQNFADCTIYISQPYFVLPK